jgi:DNA-binding transcriptional LysR family regulator
MTGLRVLAAVVRTGSLSAAARELCVTPAAISHRLRDLERQSGVSLVARVAGRFGATPAGQEVLTALGDAFERIRAADAILRKGRPVSLHIASSYSFAVLWLAPRLARFQAQHPQVQLFLEPSHSPMERDADITFLHAVQPPDARGWTQLFADRCAAVARADHPAFGAASTGVTAVLQGRLVHIAHEKGRAGGEFSWADWAKAIGLQSWVPPTGATVSAEHLAVDLVLAEDSFALVSLINVSRLIADGRLRSVPGSAAPTDCAYWACHSGAEPAAAFLSWVKDELRAAVGPPP